MERKTKYGTYGTTVVIVALSDATKLAALLSEHVRSREVNGSPGLRRPRAARSPRPQPARFEVTFAETRGPLPIWRKAYALCNLLTQGMGTWSGSAVSCVIAYKMLLTSEPLSSCSIASLEDALDFPISSLRLLHR